MYKCFLSSLALFLEDVNEIIWIKKGYMTLKVHKKNLTMISQEKGFQSHQKVSEG